MPKSFVKEGELHIGRIFGSDDSDEHVYIRLQMGIGQSVNIKVDMADFAKCLVGATVDVNANFHIQNIIHKKLHKLIDLKPEDVENYVDPDGYVIKDRLGEGRQHSSEYDSPRKEEGYFLYNAYKYVKDEELIIPERRNRF